MHEVMRRAKRAVRAKRALRGRLCRPSPLLYSGCCGQLFIDEIVNFSYLSYVNGRGLLLFSYLCLFQHYLTRDSTSDVSFASVVAIILHQSHSRAIKKWRLIKCQSIAGSTNTADGDYFRTIAVRCREYVTLFMLLLLEDH